MNRHFHKHKGLTFEVLVRKFYRLNTTIIKYMTMYCMSGRPLIRKSWPTIIVKFYRLDSFIRLLLVWMAQQMKSIESRHQNWNTEDRFQLWRVWVWAHGLRLTTLPQPLLIRFAGSPDSSFSILYISCAKESIDLFYLNLLHTLCRTGYLYPWK